MSTSSNGAESTIGRFHGLLGEGYSSRGEALVRRASALGAALRRHFAHPRKAR